MKSRKITMGQLRGKVQGVKDLQSLCVIAWMAVVVRGQDLLLSGDFTQSDLVDFLIDLMPGEPIDRTRIIKILTDKAVQDPALRNLRSMIVRNAVVAVFELVKHDLIERGLYKTRKFEPWFQMISIARNVYAHGGVDVRDHPRFDKDGKLRWNGIELRRETFDDEQTLSDALLSARAIWKLIDGAVEFHAETLRMDAACGGAVTP